MKYLLLIALMLYSSLLTAQKEFTSWDYRPDTITLVKYNYYANQTRYSPGFMYRDNDGCKTLIRFEKNKWTVLVERYIDKSTYVTSTYDASIDTHLEYIVVFNGSYYKRLDAKK